MINAIPIFFAIALMATFLLGWLCMIACAALNAAAKGKPIKPAIQPLLDEW